MSHAPRDFEGPAPDDFGTERGLALLLIVAGALYLRARAPLLNTAFMDESIYVVYGRMFLSGQFEAPLATPGQWSFGWYLWPVMATVADRVGGLAAVRELAACLGVLTVIAVYGFTSRLFSRTTGLCAAAIMAVMAPAVLVSRIATRDSGSLCFFALGLWAFAAAWTENRKRHWALASSLLFAAFLCKYLVAIFFPFLVLLALRKGRRPLFYLALPLSALCLVYAIGYRQNLAHLLSYANAYNALRAPEGGWQGIYLSQRWDFWLVALAALPALLSPRFRARAAVSWLGAVILLAFQWKTRADYDYWKHVNYALLFLIPVAASSITALSRRVAANTSGLEPILAAGAGLLLVSGVAWAGKPWAPDRFLFWPNVEPVLAYFEGRLGPQDSVLTDDTVLRYYLQPPLHQRQMTDSMYFRYNDVEGEDAYREAVRQGEFTYIVLDGGMDEAAQKMGAAIRPLPKPYELALVARDPVLCRSVEIYARRDATPPAPEGKAAISIEKPLSRSTAGSRQVIVEGRISGATPGWYVCVDVFTDRWYPQGGQVLVGKDGRFRQAATLGGAGWQQRWHLVRARLYDAEGAVRARALNYAIACDGA